MTSTMSLQQQQRLTNHEVIVYCIVFLIICGTKQYYYVDIIVVFESTQHWITETRIPVCEQSQMPEKISMTWYFWLWHDIVCWQRDVMSVHLEGGHVVFQYSFHGRPSVRLQSRHRYNRNKWVTVVASRMKLEGMSHVASWFTLDMWACAYHYVHITCHYNPAYL